MPDFLVISTAVLFGGILLAAFLVGANQLRYFEDAKDAPWWVFAATLIPLIYLIVNLSIISQ